MKILQYLVFLDQNNFFWQVERGMSWEAAEQKKDEAAQDENEGYWLSMQVRFPYWLFAIPIFIAIALSLPQFSNTDFLTR